MYLLDLAMLPDTVWRMVMAYACPPVYEYRFQWPTHLIGIADAVNEIWASHPLAYHYLVPHMDLVKYTRPLCDRTEDEVVQYLLSHPERIDRYHFADNPHPDVVDWCLENMEMVQRGNAQPYVNPSRKMVQYWLDRIDTLSDHLKEMVLDTLARHHATWAIELGETKRKAFSENPDDASVAYLIANPGDIVAEGWVRNANPDAQRHAYPYRQHMDRMGFFYKYKRPFWTEDDVDFYLSGTPLRLLDDLHTLATVNHPRIGQRLLDLYLAGDLPDRVLSLSPCEVVVRYLLKHPMLISWDLFGANPGAFRLVDVVEWLHGPLQGNTVLPSFESIQSLQPDSPLPILTAPTWITCDKDWWDYEEVHDETNAVEQAIADRLIGWQTVHRAKQLIPTVWVSEQEWGKFYLDASSLLSTMLKFCQYRSSNGSLALRRLNTHFLNGRVKQRRIQLLQVRPFMSHQSGHHCDGWYVPDEVLLSYAFVRRELQRVIRQWCPLARVHIGRMDTARCVPQIVVESRCAFRKSEQNALLGKARKMRKK